MLTLDTKRLMTAYYLGVNRLKHGRTVTNFTQSSCVWLGGLLHVSVVFRVVFSNQHESPLENTVIKNHAHITDEQDGTWWTVPKALTKGRNRDKAGDLRVPLVGRALDVVQRLRLQDGRLFPSMSRAGVVGHQMQTYMQSKVHYLQPYSHSRPDHIRDRLTVTHWSPHDLRRTGRTMLAQIGCPAEVAESILGHVMPGVQDVYDRHSYDAERRQWLGLWSDKLESLCDFVQTGSFGKAG